MSNHDHLLIETLEANLGRAMRGLNGNYATQFNRVHQRVGHLFQGRYNAILVDRDSYLVELSRYIHLNPVRAGIVARAADYQWSSAPAYVGRCAAPAFLTVADLLGHFGRTVSVAQPRYQEFLRQGERRPSSPSPLDAVVAGTLLGAPDWVHDMRCRIVAPQDAGGTDRLRDEIPALSKLEIRPTLDEVIDAVSRALEVDRSVITNRHLRSKARRVALYLTDHLTGLGQREIGAAFGIGRFAVSKASAMIAHDLAANGDLGRLVRRLYATLRRSQP